jgi:hypothetical protein
MDDLKKLGFAGYVDKLSFPELKRFIANINKYVREDLIIRTTKKTHDALKKEVKSVWQVLLFDGVAGLETKSLKEIDDVLPRKSQNLKKPSARQISKVEKDKEKQVMREASATLARVKKAMSKK